MTFRLMLFVFSPCTDDDCEKRLQRLREVVAGKTPDLTKYVSSSRSCEADDEFDDEEEKGGEKDTDQVDEEKEDEDEEPEEQDSQKEGD